MDEKQYENFITRFKKPIHIQFFDKLCHSEENLKMATETFKFPNYVDLTTINPELCNTFGEKHSHHYTPKYCYSNILPIICKELNIDFDMDKFYEKKIYSEKYDNDIALELKNDKNIFIYKSLVDKKEIKGNHFSVVRNIKRKNYEPYHDLFRGSHTPCIIKNLTTKETRRLLLNCDSMLVPIVPVLCYFFKEIVHMDNRTTDILYHDLLDSYYPSDYVCALITRNILRKQYLNNLR